jgi:hypothetical protein
MTREELERWVAALESGKYEQNQGSLMSNPRDDEDQRSYCCLGVLCKVSGVDPELWDEFTDLESAELWDGEKESLPYLERAQSGAARLLDTEENKWLTVQGYENWLNLRHYFGLSPADHCTLVGLNDASNWSFTRIAEWVKANVKDDKGKTLEDYKVEGSL